MRMLLVALLLAALLPGIAGALPPRTGATSRPDVTSPRRPTPPPRVVEYDRGFQWEDALVGGASALGFVLVFAGGGSLRARRRARVRLSR